MPSLSRRQYTFLILRQHLVSAIGVHSAIFMPRPYLPAQHELPATPPPYIPLLHDTMARRHHSCACFQGTHFSSRRHGQPPFQFLFLTAYRRRHFFRRHARLSFVPRGHELSVVLLDDFRPATMKSRPARVADFIFQRQGARCLYLSQSMDFRGAGAAC